MKTSTISFELPENRLRSLVGDLKKSVEDDCGTSYPESTIRRSVIAWLDERLDGLVEEALERLTSPTYDDYRQFAQILERVDGKSTVAPIRPELSAETVSVFNGYRLFSLEKMAAMIAYLANSTSDLYKTKLNKLLFYADFVNYYLHGNSISGSRYVHLPYGPVPDGYEDTLETLNHYGVIDLAQQKAGDLITTGEGPKGEFLSPDEQQTLDWIVEEFGSMSASQLTELSHRERAYSNTRAGEEIAYEYAKFLSKLPPKTA